MTNNDPPTARTLDMTSVPDKPKALKPTDEQVAALDAFSTRGDLVIEAGAGTGKTSTLKLLADSTSLRGQYVAFNKAIVSEAQSKFPRNVAANTAHSLAFRAVGKPFAGRLRSSQRMRARDLAEALGIERGIKLPSGGFLSQGFLAGIATRAAVRFCQTADATITTRHVPYQQGLDDPNDDGSRSYVNNDVLAEFIVPFARNVWDDGINPDGKLPYKHDFYVKLWEQSSPVMPVDFVLFDEAQDASPVLMSIVQQQADAQKVWVGDSNQQIYEFTGAVNALAKVDAEHHTMLTQSFRFGDAIAGAANSVLSRLDTDMRIRGLASVDDVVGEVANPDAILTRTNALCVTEYLTYRAMNRAPHIVGGGDEVVRFAEAAESLMSSGWTPHPELTCFKSWGEVQDYVATDVQGDELRLLVRLVDEFSPRTIIAELRKMTPARDADLTISTAHKSKGLEWDRVSLSSDFPIATEDKPLTPQDERLLYVAVTRARRELDPGVLL